TFGPLCQRSYVHSLSGAALARLRTAGIDRVGEASHFGDDTTPHVAERFIERARLRYLRCRLVLHLLGVGAPILLINSNCVAPTHFHLLLPPTHPFCPCGVAGAQSLEALLGLPDWRSLWCLIRQLCPLCFSEP